MYHAIPKAKLIHILEVKHYIAFLFSPQLLYIGGNGGKQYGIRQEYNFCSRSRYESELQSVSLDN